MELRISAWIFRIEMSIEDMDNEVKLKRPAPLPEDVTMKRNGNRRK